MKRFVESSPIEPETWLAAVKQALQTGQAIEALAKKLGVPRSVLFQRLLEASLPGTDRLDVYRSRHREMCHDLLQEWMPLAFPPERGSDGADSHKTPFKDGLEASLKASQLILKIMERLVKLDNLDATEALQEREGEPKGLDPLDVARRVMEAMKRAESLA